MPRVTVPAAEDLIGKEIKCLNHGHVMLVDYMGGDYSVTQSARVSYAQDMKDWDEKKDPGLLNYLMAHRHTTPFEMVQVKVRMKHPLVVARQWIRHRTASVNEVSARYTKLPDQFYVPEPNVILPQSKDNKQGRSDDGSFTLEDQLVFASGFKEEQLHIYDQYDKRINLGMAKELARLNLPVSIYTEWYWNQNLWNMFHLLGLRMDSHAQYEIRVYANALYEICKAVAPISCAAWENHMFRATRFSKKEMDLLHGMLSRFKASSEDLDLTNLTSILGVSGAKEFLDKLKG